MDNLEEILQFIFILFLTFLSIHTFFAVRVLDYLHYPTPTPSFLFPVLHL